MTAQRGRRPGRTLLRFPHVEARRRAIAKLEVLERPPAVEISSIFDVPDVDQCSACEGKVRQLATIGHVLQRAAAENA